MKHIYILLTTILITLFAVSCDRGEDPSYNELSVDVTDIVLDRTKGDTIRDIKLLSDNNNYRLEYVNQSNGDQMLKDSAKVELLQNDKIFTFIGKKRGIVYFKLYDWTNQESLIKVTVKEDVDLVLNEEEILFRLGDESQEIEIYDGNGGYEFTFDNPEQKVVDVNLVEPEDQDLTTDLYQIKGNITVAPKSVGKTVLKVTDSTGKQFAVNLEVKDLPIPLQLVDIDPNKVLFMETSSTLVIPFEGGESGYNVSSSSSVITASLDQDAKEITLTSKTSASKVNITLTDNAGQKIVLTVQVDKPFLEDKTLRIFRKRSRSTISNTIKGGGYLASMNKTIFEVGSTYIGFGITYTGNLEIGEKTEARIYDVYRGQEKEGTSTPLSICTLEKVEDNYYWFTFTEAETGDEGYMVFQGPNELKMK